MELPAVNQHFGNVDIYLLDQILKNKFQLGMKVLDAGCGEGRNLMHFINSGYDVYGIDINPMAIKALQFIISSIRPDLSKNHFKEEDIANLSFPDNTFDLIIASAVLHFASDHNHFYKMVGQLIRSLKSGAMLFIRMTSDIGIENLVVPKGSGRFLIPDGSVRFLLTREILEKLESLYSLKYLEQFKTVNVNDLRCMSTLMVTIP